MKKIFAFFAPFALTAFLSFLATLAIADGGRLYAEHCASCHGEQRLGGMGPALLPSNLERLRRPAQQKS